jgi:hypothetical protein
MKRISLEVAEASQLLVDLLVVFSFLESGDFFFEDMGNEFVGARVATNSGDFRKATVKRFIDLYFVGGEHGLIPFFRKQDLLVLQRSVKQRFNRQGRQERQGIQVFFVSEHRVELSRFTGV